MEKYGYSIDYESGVVTLRKDMFDDGGKLIRREELPVPAAFLSRLVDDERARSGRIADALRSRRISAGELADSGDGVLNSIRQEYHDGLEAIGSESEDRYMILDGILDSHMEGLLRYKES